MGVIRINSSDSKDGQVQDDKKSVRNILLELNHDEAQILLKACQQYRAKIPSYLKAKQSELNIINALIHILNG